MTSFSAKMNKASKGHAGLVVFVVYPGVKLLDLAGPLQVFTDARGPDGKAAYRIVLASLEGGLVATDTAVGLPTQSLDSLARRSVDTLLVAGGSGVHEALRRERLLREVSKLGKKARRRGAICTGAFILAGAGLLTGKRAVTHWQNCAGLAADYPAVRVESDPIYIRDGSTWTSAGVTAGIDLALAMVAEDLGRPAALALARELVAFMVRPGGQSQFSAALDRQAADAAGRFEPLHHWIAENLDSDLRVEALADFMHMSPRSFARLYAAETGTTPAKAVEALRVEAARSLLESSDHSVAAVAQRCGFGDDERMRRAFARSLHTSPQDYRRHFQV